MKALDEAEAAAAAAQNMPQRADEPERWEIPPLIGKKGISRLLGISEPTVKRWRGIAIKALAAGDHTSEHLPKPDRTVELRPLWYPITIVGWALGNSIPLRVADLVIPPVTELWSQEDIANHFGIEIDTVRDRWRHLYTNAIKHNRTPPDKALPKEDYNVEGVVFWLPDTVKRWGERQGKLDEDQRPNPRNHLRWVSPQKARPEPVDEVRLKIDKGELMDRAAIGTFFGVSPNTVKMWMTDHSSGKDFPEPDGPPTRKGRATWLPSTVIAWGEAADDDKGSKRIVNGQVVHAKGGRPMGSTKEKIEKTKKDRAARRAAKRAAMGLPPVLPEHLDRQAA